MTRRYPVTLVGGPREGDEVELDRTQLQHGRLIHFARFAAPPAFLMDRTDLEPTAAVGVDTYRLEFPPASFGRYAVPVARWVEPTTNTKGPTS